MKDTKGVERALNFIEENLGTKISLEDIADAANYSQWYFHRLFRVLTGYCVNDYLRKRRLCEASHVLLYTTKSIAKIAKDFQFESQAAFTRSFSSVAGITPGKFRQADRSVDSISCPQSGQELQISQERSNKDESTLYKQSRLRHYRRFLPIKPQ